MVADFPLPREELPQIKVTPREHEEARELANHMLAHTVLEFEKFVYRDKNHVDPRLWKGIGSRDRLKLYKQREGGITHAVRTQRIDSMSELPSEAITAATDPGSLMMTGYWPGRVENAMYAVVTKSQEELALVVIYLHEDVADCAILHTMEGQTPENPYHFLGYKFFVRKSPTNAHMVRHRDSLYLEYCGVTKTSQGEEIGYHIMHSVDIPGFPDLTRRNSVRTRQSVRYIYRQKAENIVEIYMLGSLSISGTLGGFGPVSTFFTADSLFGIARLVDCAEVKRLTACVRERQRNIDLLERREKGMDCAICRQRKKMFTSVSLSECMTCGQFICQRCRLFKKMFIGDGILGRFQKICVCKTCVLAANEGDFRDPIHVSLTNRENLRSRRQRAASSASASSYAASDASGGSDGGSGGSSLYTSSSEATSSIGNSTQQAHYHTQYADRGHGGISGTSSNGSGPRRAQRSHPSSVHGGGSGPTTTTRSQDAGGMDEYYMQRPTLADISHDLIPLDLEPSSPESSVSMVVYDSYPPSQQQLSSGGGRHYSTDSRTNQRTESTSSSVASTRFYTPPTPSAIAVGVPVDSFDAGYYQQYSNEDKSNSFEKHYSTPIGLSRTGSGSSARAPSTTSTSSTSASTMHGGGASGPEQDLLARMMELRRVADATYNTTQENAALLSQRY
ncbi:hypothetical protein Gpo141_00009721 [Globisporangium polare]